MRLVPLLAVTIVAVAACSSKPDFPMYTGDCGAIQTKVSSLSDLPAATGETAVKMCTDKQLRQTTADGILKATDAKELEWKVKEELKWMEFHNKR